VRNIAKEEQYLCNRNFELSFIQEQYKTDEIERILSPDGLYQLTIEHFTHYEGHIRYSHTLGIITSNIDSEYRVEIKRNMGHFMYKWVKKDNTSYLICGQDYQGYSIVDLEDGTIFDFVPEEAYEGHGFCWAAIHYSDITDVLVVEGCIWACEYEIVFYDFSKPLELPYKELKRVSPYEKIIGWKEKGFYDYEDENKSIQTIQIIKVSIWKSQSSNDTVFTLNIIRNYCTIN
jgi:hypothetical protein